jgi:tripartite-type tricarboxylate transporter receptor subunit TctC
LIASLTSIAALCGAALFTSPASAQAPAAYPTKAIRFIVAFAPGGPADIIARLLGQQLSEAVGQPVIVENRAGAGGNIATGVVAKSPNDGYTLLINTSAYAVNPSLSRKAGYDPLKDLTLSTIVASSPNLLVAYPGLKAKTLQEVIADAKGGKLNYGTAGAGTTPHLTAEYLFKVLARVEVTHVPFAGAGPALTPSAARSNWPASRCPRRSRWSRAARCAAWRSPAPSGCPSCPMCPPWPNPASLVSRTTPGSACSPPPARRWQ